MGEQLDRADYLLRGSLRILLAGKISGYQRRLFSNMAGRAAQCSKGTGLSILRGHHVVRRAFEPALVLGPCSGNSRQSICCVCREATVEDVQRVTTGHDWGTVL